MSVVGLSPDARVSLEREGLPELFARFVKDHGLRHAQYISSDAPWFKQPVLVGTVPQDRIVALLDVIRTIAPHVDHGTWKSISVNWRDLKQLTDEQEAALECVRKEFGRNGFTIRLVSKPHSVGLNFTTDDDMQAWNAKSADVLWKGQLLGQKIHDMILTAAGKGGQRKPELSETQAEILSLLASGMTIPTICQQSGMNERKVLQNLNKAQKKLEAHNHAHAVAKAIVMGLIVA